MDNKTRRDFLFLASGVVGVSGVAAAGWPFIDQMRPDKGQAAAASVEVDLSKIEEGMSVTIKWRGQPVVIRNRTKKEIDAARAVALEELKDNHARNPNIDANAQADDLSRSAGVGHESWIIMVNLCTHLNCVPLGQSGPYKGWFCPCHGSAYDTAGRIRSGPADRNLAIPPYEFLSDTLVKIG